MKRKRHTRFRRRSTFVTINGVEKTRIAGEGFNRALLKVWLGDYPVQADLNNAMLGG